MDHFKFVGKGQPLTYGSRGAGGRGDKRVRRQNPTEHGRRLLGELGDAFGQIPPPEAVEQEYFEGTAGRQISFVLDFGVRGASAVDELGGAKYGIEVLNVLPLEGSEKRVILYVPFSATTFVIDQLKNFTDTAGAASVRWASISSIEAVVARSLYSENDPSGYFPARDTEAKWLELWLVRTRAKVVEELCDQHGIKLDEQRLTFHDRIVVLARLSPKQLVDSHLINLIAEICMPTFSITQLHGMPGYEQNQLLSGVQERLLLPESRIRVALIDSGIQRGHPLLNSVVKDEDLYDVDDEDGLDDRDHGTGMASLILYGADLERIVSSGDPVLPAARLESVKTVLPLVEEPATSSDPKLLGLRTALAFGLLPTLPGGERRVFVSSISRNSKSKSGAPDSYSATLDLLAFGGSPVEGSPSSGSRFIIQSAGNSTVGEPRTHLEPPAQAWNPLIVGACTKRPVKGVEPGRHLSAAGTLSPSSSHGLKYEPKYALKPDVVMEGGNAERTELGDIEKSPECMLLAASSRYPQQFLALFDGTSAAAGLAGHLAAKIWARYPEISPESVRALIVNSAEWTDEMLAAYRPNRKQDGYTELVQQCGMGAPNPYLAVDSTQQFITLLYEDRLVPFVPPRKDQKQQFHEFQVIQLPWPVDELRAYPEYKAEIRVTLSHFIEPNPSNRDYVNRYAFESHGLRFSFKRKGESSEDFYARVSKEQETEENLRIIAANKLKPKSERVKIKRADSDKRWCLGPDLRTRGSIHSDLWIGSTPDCAGMDEVAVFPISGWWRHTPDETRHGRSVDYSLAISLTLQGQPDASLYNAVQQVINDSQQPRATVEV